MLQNIIDVVKHCGARGASCVAVERTPAVFASLLATACSPQGAQRTWPKIKIFRPSNTRYKFIKYVKKWVIKLYNTDEDRTN